MIWLGVMVIFIMCALLFLLSFSLELNTIEQNYVVCLGRFFRIQYACCQKQRGLRFFFFGGSFFRRFRFMQKEKAQKKRKKEKPSKKRVFVHLVREQRVVFFQLAISLRALWNDLQRLSSSRVEWDLCTPDYMANAFLSALLFAWGVQGIRVNYWGENWFIFSFTMHLWAFFWIVLKFTFSPPILKMGFSWVSLSLRNS